MVSKAVLPVAGLGTRFLPVTKAVPKEMLPVVDRPAIQYVVEECVRAGLTDVLLVTGAGKSAIEDHFDRAGDLEAALAAKDKTAELEQVRDLADLATVHSVRQPEPLGLGHAVHQAAAHVGDEPFAVLLGDDLLAEDSTDLQRMIAAHERTGRPVVGLLEVDEAQTHLYGIAETRGGTDGDEVAVTGLVEKPDAGQAPSRLAVIGRYVLPASVFSVLERTPPGRGGEIQLTDALAEMAADEPLVGVVCRADRYDTGDRLGFLKATVEVAARRDDVGPAFLAWLRERLDQGLDA